MKRWVKITVFGTVQGVGYCEHVKEYADKFSIEGTVQYEDRGSVLIYAAGSNEALDDFIDYVYQGSKKSLVEEVAIEIATSSRDFRGVFRIIA
ncbi:MAG: acylphosphatase [Candidatus Dependentiae bacterium]|nr:acylphosphatase [Candidatus Dependentiae bacterium]